jgi:hypothetical protein
MPRHQTSDDLAVQDEGVAISEEEVWRFEGAGVSAADDPGNDRTLVTIDGGAATELGYRQQYFYNASISLATGGGAVALNCGSETESNGTAFLDDMSTDATTGVFVFAEQGLYQVQVEIARIEDDPGLLVQETKRVSLEAAFVGRDFPLPLRYAPVIPYRGNAFSQVQWRALIDFTDVFEVGDSMTVTAVRSYDFEALGFQVVANFAKLV